MASNIYPVPQTRPHIVAADPALPHLGVYARLKPSTLDLGGVGVFAVRDIKKGTYIFEPDDDDIVWVDPEDTARLLPEIQRFYHDFCVKRQGRFGCPANFNRLTISWYLNHSERPNVGCDEEYKFFALRDIECDEELTADYRTYSERDSVPGA